MTKIASSRRVFRPNAGFVAFVLLLAALWLAGGASRGDAAGQVIVRAAAFVSLIATILLGRRPIVWPAGPALIFLGLAALIAVLQLLPLPPDIWQALPGREVVGAIASDAKGTWRPVSLVPGATINALFALVVPLSVLVSAMALNADERARLPGLVLAAVTASMLLGMLQFTGVAINNPLVNETPGVISGTFANRNHFALFLALGCLLVPVWTFGDGRRTGWRGPIGLGLLLLFTLTILATGSRAGIALGALALVLAGIMAQHGLRRELRHAPRWVLPAVVVAVVAVIGSFVIISVAADRAVSIQRSFASDLDQDIRIRAFSTVWSTMLSNFPVGTGLGSFDPVFRIHEPFSLLKPTYFNQAHNDFVGVVLDAGLPGLLLLAAALAWWVRVSVRAWRDQEGAILPRLGSAMLLLVFVASAFDYPARTPLIMAMVALAATWLSGGSNKGGPSALPGSDQHL